MVATFSAREGKTNRRSRATDNQRRFRMGKCNGLMWWIIRSSHHSCVKPFGTRQQAKENAMSATDAMFSPRDPWRIPCVRCALRVFFCFYRSDAARLTKEAHPFGMKLRRMGCPVLLLLLLDGHAFVHEQRFGAVGAVAGDFADLLDHVIALGD